MTEDSQQECGSSNGGEDEPSGPRVVLLGAHRLCRSLDEIDLAFMLLLLSWEEHTGLAADQSWLWH